MNDQSLVDVNAAKDSPVGQLYLYKSVGGQNLTLYVLSPTSNPLNPKRPAILFFHGGGWTKGSPSQFNQQCRHLASRGIVCIQVQYRFLDLANPQPPLVCIQDAKTAMRWARSHAQELGIDVDRIAAAGGSAGGHLAACTALLELINEPTDDLTLSAKPQALLLFNPVLDNGPQGYGYHLFVARHQELSLFEKIDSKCPPCVIFLGTEDKLIPVETMEKFQTAMQEKGVRCDLHLYEKQAHGFFNFGRPDGKFTETLAECEKFLISLDWIPRRA